MNEIGWMFVVGGLRCLLRFLLMKVLALGAQPVGSRGKGVWLRCLYARMGLGFLLHSEVLRVSVPGGSQDVYFPHWSPK